ncbi:hypothetical protein AAU61_04565 [Desulfocarbo indianensis]|nr:hypothetical protein AAU61_04565 [Desulfocarbo indianensis]
MKRIFWTALALAAGLLWHCPALAAESPGASVTVGGRMLTDFGWWTRDKELTANQKEDVTGSFVNLPGHSYLRATWTSADKNAGGLVELGLKSHQPEASVSLRYAYGWWKSGNFRLLAGRTDNWFGSLAYHARQYLGLNEGGHAYLWGWGQLWPDRVAQAQLTYETPAWGLQFALEDPRDQTGAAGQDFYGDLPRFSLTARITAGGFMTHPGFSFVRHSYEGSGLKQEYDTWAVNLPLRYVSGALGLKLQIHYGVNFYQEYPFYPALAAPVAKAGGSLEDTETLGGLFSLEYKIGNTMLIGAVGYERFENDAWKGLGFRDDSSQRLALVAALHIDLNPFFSLHPEVALYDHGDDPLTGESQGREWLAGAQFSWIF